MTDDERKALFLDLDIFLRLCWVMRAFASGRCARCGRSEIHFHAA